MEVASHQPNWSILQFGFSQTNNCLTPFMKMG